MNASTPEFDGAFRKELARLIEWRRDVRRFRTDSVPAPLIDSLLKLAQFAPSVGNSQPWRIVRVESAGKRQAIRDNFLRCNAEALAEMKGERAKLYARLKLAGLDAAPVQIAAFCDRETRQGHGLGIHTMPEMLDYSVTEMISCLWLAARAAGLGLGWVSILDPVEAAATLDVPNGFKFIAYLCIGWPEEEHIDPELERHGWQDRTDSERKIFNV